MILCQSTVVAVIVIEYDSILMIDKTTDFSHVHIYVGDIISHHPIELRIDSYKDLIPYFPFVSSSVYSNGEHNYYIGNEPAYVHEEWNILESDVRYIKRVYNRFKRQKREIAVNAILDECKDWLWHWKENETTHRELIKRIINAKGKDIRFKDLQLDYSQHFRQRLYDTMIENGYNTHEAMVWCFGWRKALELGMSDQTLD